MSIKDKFHKDFISPITGKNIRVYFGDKNYDQIREYNPKTRFRALKQAGTLLRHYKNNTDPLISKDTGVPTPKAMVATIWGFKYPVTTKSQQKEVVKYAENLIKKWE